MDYRDFKYIFDEENKHIHLEFDSVPFQQVKELLCIESPIERAIREQDEYIKNNVEQFARKCHEKGKYFIAIKPDTTFMERFTFDESVVRFYILCNSIDTLEQASDLYKDGWEILDTREWFKEGNE